jgi:hypothetical protein
MHLICFAFSVCKTIILTSDKSALIHNISHISSICMCYSDTSIVIDWLTLLLHIFRSLLHHAFSVIGLYSVDSRETSEWWWWIDEDKYPCLRWDLIPWFQRPNDQGLRLRPRCQCDKPNFMFLGSDIVIETGYRDWRSLVIASYSIKKIFVSCAVKFKLHVMILLSAVCDIHGWLPPTQCLQGNLKLGRRRCLQRFYSIMLRVAKMFIGRYKFLSDRVIK